MNNALSAISERLYTSYGQSWTDYKTIVDVTTKFQHMHIINTAMHGNVLLLDNVVQLTEKDEFFYSESMIHPAILQSNPLAGHDILIIGGGDGAVAEEAYKYPRATITMVEIDDKVVAECDKHFTSVNNGIFNRQDRFTLHIGCGLEFLKDTNQKFSVISTDRPDPVGPATSLFEEEFYLLCKRRMYNDGMLLAQNGVPFYQLDEFFNTKSILQKVFKYSGFFFISVPTYIGGLMSIAWGSDKPLISEKDMFKNLTAIGLDLKYFNASIYNAMQATPTYLLKGFK
ncbi:MAG: polyamine aminopropyltransferase [Richelia sp. RM2_1_2]|nr:polyamine aminopropyltransferase [Richelia sp. RM2_1_2]